MFEYRCVADFFRVSFSDCLTRLMLGRKKCGGGYSGGVDRVHAFLNRQYELHELPIITPFMHGDVQPFYILHTR